MNYEKNTIYNDCSLGNSGIMYTILEFMQATRGLRQQYSCKQRKKRIVLIDNYVDETVLTLLDKRDNNVSAIIYTQQIRRQFQLDMDRHNAQYAPIDVETFRLSHDRFLCIDDDVYHIGASIKDLGKKWFGFSKMEILTPDELVERINRE